MLKVLIVEDDALIAYDLDSVVAEAGHVVIGPVASVREAEVLLPLCDAVCLDVDVRDGTTFELAKRLRDSSRAFTFVTGSVPSDIPAELRRESIIRKPYTAAAIRRWLTQLEGRSSAGVRPDPVPTPAAAAL